jgi:hypothetical protein
MSPGSHSGGVVARFLSAGWVLATVGLLILTGCASTEETAEEQVGTAPPSEAPGRPVSFEMSTDTVDVLRRGERSSGVLEPGRGDTLYSVQIGAFKDPGNAASAEKQARERFQHPVLRYHEQGPGLYHIRVGRFATRRAAEDFRTEMRTAYPRDYGDCWIVRLTETQ